MAKDKTEDHAKKEKKEKKDKKRKHAEVIDDADSEPVVSTLAETPAKKDKKEKKERKDKKRKSSSGAAIDVDADGDVTIADASVVEVKDDEEDEKKIVVKSEVPLAALVPFANPLCDEKSQKKVLKGVKKGQSVHLTRRKPPPSRNHTKHARPRRC